MHPESGRERPGKSVAGPERSGSGRRQREWQWAWLLVPIVVIISYLSLTSIAATEEERLFLSLVHFLLCLGLIGFAATPKLSGPFKGLAEYALLAPPIFLPLLNEVGVVTTWLLKCIEVGRREKIAVPTPETGAPTNFIR